MNKNLALIITHTIGFDSISKKQLINDFEYREYPEEEIDDAINFMISNNIIIPNDNEGYDVIITNVDDFPEDIVKDLYDNGYDEHHLNRCLTAYSNRKVEKSQILNDEWTPVFTGDIPSGELLIRIKSNKKILHQTKQSVYYAETVRLAEYDNGVWKLTPPYQKYELNPMITDDHKIDPDSVVTHYKVPTDEELDMWEKGFEFINDYKEFSFHVDSDHELMVYDALLFAMAAVNNSLSMSNDDIELRGKFGNALRVLNDIKVSIDTGREIHAVD